MPSGLTVLAPIRPECLTALRGTLAAIGGDVAGRRLGQRPVRPHVHFARMPRLHFARLAVLDDPDRGPGRARLLFSSNYDGTLAEHLDELAAATTDMDAVWGACEGYAGVQAFHEFVRAHAHEPNAFYIAFRDPTAAAIRLSLQARRQLESHVDRDGPAFLADAARATRPQSWTGLYDELRASTVRTPSRWAPLARVPGIVLEALRLLRRHRLSVLVRAMRSIVASLNRLPAARVFNRLTRNGMPPVRSRSSSAVTGAARPCAPLAPGDDIPSDNTRRPPRFDEEDAVTQNQLTLVTTIGPGGREHVEAVMALIDAYSRHLSPPGSLIGISTIHFVRWLVIDEGRRLMMLSDYDGSWEAYIDEFAEMILSGLDAIWGTALGYPPDGARDIVAFKRFLRCHQVPASAFYSAYPESTVLNVGRDLPLVQALAAGLRRGRTDGWSDHL